MPRFGAHLSIAGGLHHAIAAARRFGCDCLQVFLKNQRQWRARPLSRTQLAAWHAARAAAADIAPIVAHDSYLTNLASPTDSLWQKSFDGLLDELDRCQALGIDYLVVHPGSHLGYGEAFGIERIIKALDGLIERRPGLTTKILLELTAGQGHVIGYRFEHLARILGGVAKPDFFGACLDTCHAFAAGYDLRTAPAVAETLDRFERIVGLARLLLVHVNDSKRPLGSRVDRHEHIGRGKIGRAGFAAIVNEPRLAEMPMILETPKGLDPRTKRDWDAINLATLRRLTDESGTADKRR